jgi:transcription elongation factor GreA
VEKKTILTTAGLKKYEDELEDLKVNRRREIAEKIKEAREQGDLSENAEYDAAKDEQRDIESRIEELEALLKNVEVVDETDVNLDKINVGCQVKILDVDENEEMDVSIVGSSEADTLEDRIANDSPLGKALIGHGKGEIVNVDAPIGQIRYKILDIRKVS